MRKDGRENGVCSDVNSISVQPVALDTEGEDAVFNLPEDETQEDTK